MKQEFLPYYISRAVLSAIFGILVFGFSWKAGIFAAVTFALFLLYLHSGWFQIDRRSPWFPVRRDERGEKAQRKALIAAVLTGAVFYAIFSLASQWYILPSIGSSLALILAILAYFLTQFLLLAKA
ncbi:MAG TPA: hypothetical protein VLM80_04165 [Anaerolineales bacterium]|nr:hypothetical protein [Anaerolineales bacterium]